MTTLSSVGWVPLSFSFLVSISLFFLLDFLPTFFMGSLNLESCYESSLESDRVFSKVGMTKGKGGSPTEYPH
jgi:hypothetical protein